MNTEEILNFINNNSFSQSFAWLVTIVAGLIGIYQFYFKRTENIEELQDEPLEINYKAKGLCADCNSYISSNSDSCSKCGSTNPFDYDSLKELITKDLDFNFHLAKRHINNHKDLLINVKYYNYLFIPAILSTLLIAYIGTIWDNFIIEFFTAISGLCVLFYFVGLPYTIINDLSSKFNLGKCSEEKLVTLGEKIHCITNSLNSKKDLKNLSVYLNEYIELIDKSKTNKYGIHFWVYVFLQILILYFSLNLAESAFKELLIGDFGEKAIILGITLVLCYFLSLTLFRLYWVHLIYLKTSLQRGKRHLKHQLYIIDSKIEK